MNGTGDFKNGNTDGNYNNGNFSTYGNSGAKVPDTSYGGYPERENGNGGTDSFFTQDKRVGQCRFFVYVPSTRAESFVPSPFFSSLLFSLFISLLRRLPLPES